MSFMLTTEQVRRREKRITRRLGWWFVKIGDIYRAVDKCMGFKKGEHPEELAIIQVKNHNPESLNSINATEVYQEGFPGMSPRGFVEMFCKMNKHKKCTPDTIVNRIVFDYL